MADLSAQQALRRDLEPAVIVIQSKGNFSDVLDSLPFPVEYLNLKGVFDFRISKYFRLLGKLKKYDVIHLHDFSPVIAYCCRFACKHLMYTEHGNFELNRAPKRFDRLIIMLRRRFIRKRIWALIYNSNFSRDTATDHYKIKNKNSFVIFNGLAPVRDQNSEIETGLQITKDKFVIGTSSRFAYVKRIDRLIRAFHIADIEDSVLLLIGDGPLKNEYIQLTQQLGISEKVIVTGFQLNVKAYQQLLDVCVFPSAFESFGLVALETLLLGKPTLCMKDGGGLVEILSDIEPENICADENELASRIKFWYAHKAEISDRSAQRIEYAGKYSIQRMEEQYFEVIAELKQQN